LGLLARSEAGLVPKATFVLTWGALNFWWLLWLRRPAASAALALAMIVILILLSQLKHEALLMTANFIDLMLIDDDTISFLLKVFPGLERTVGLILAFALPALGLLWWFDPFRLRLRSAALGGVACLAGLAILSLAVPSDREEELESSEYVSKFARSAAVDAIDLLTRGLLESDTAAASRLVRAQACAPPRKLPNIVLILDESSFDISVVPGVKVPPGYHEHFRSFDGKTRSFVVEGAGGPTWYTEYNVLTGLSSRSYGRFAEFVTRIAAGRVARGLPLALSACGYRTYSLYPWLGAFLSAKHFQNTAGIDHFLDAKDMGTRNVEPDRFYYNAALDVIRHARGERPLFIFSYLMANHFPWTYRFHPELAPDWRDLGNIDVGGHRIDEYLRRQAMSARDYADFTARLASEFPDQSFLLVRFGDHQPLFAKYLIDPTLDEAALGRQILAFDPRFFTTYYAIDAVNFDPVDLALARDRLDAPYLPLIVLEAAGVPLDPSFAEQKKILQRCNGLFYLCADGAEARRFNRLLIDAGLIKRL
jgi:phosphoglycerol transferase MdoB-like AlkP superfamily enzyme